MLTAGRAYEEGRRLHEAGRFAEAIARLTEARAGFEEIGRRFGLDTATTVASCNQVIGIGLLKRGSYADAVEPLALARQAFHAHGMTLDVARCDQNLGVALSALGSLDEAIERYEASVRAFEAANKPAQAAGALLDLGIALVERDRPRAALGPLSRACRVFDQQGDELKPKVAECEVTLAVALESLGRHAEAMKHKASAQALRSRYGS